MRDLEAQVSHDIHNARFFEGLLGRFITGAVSDENGAPAFQKHEGNGAHENRVGIGGFFGWFPEEKVGLQKDFAACGQRVEFGERPRQEGLNTVYVE